MRRLCLLLCLCCPLWCDQVTLKNGDRISGSIVKYDGKNLVVKSESAGQVTIPWDAVTGISSTAPLNVGLKDGQVVVGTIITAPDGRIQVTTQNAGTVFVSRDSIDFIRSKDEQTAYQREADRLRNPRVIDLWTGLLDLGFSIAHGNADTETFTLNATANRTTARDKISVNYTQIYSSTELNGVSGATANAKRGGIAYNLNVSPRWFVFGSTDLENDQFQSLDLRFAPAGGGGYHLAKSANTQFDAQVGASLDKEFFSTGLNRTFGEILLAEAFTHKFNAVSSINEKLAFYPNMSSTGNYRMNFDTSIATAIRKWFSWQFSVSDRYLSDPLAGRKKNDVLFTTGLRLTFAK